MMRHVLPAPEMSTEQHNENSIPILINDGSLDERLTDALNLRNHKKPLRHQATDLHMVLSGDKSHTAGPPSRMRMNSNSPMNVTANASSSAAVHGWTNRTGNNEKTDLSQSPVAKIPHQPKYKSPKKHQCATQEVTGSERHARE